MTALDDVTKKKAERSVEQQAAVELVRLAQEQGLSLTGPDGLLKLLTKTVLETASSHQKTQLPDGCSTKPCLLSASMQATNPPSPTAHVPFLPDSFLPALMGLARDDAHSRPDR
jgi:hypothetical protein